MKDARTNAPQLLGIVVIAARSTARNTVFRNYTSATIWTRAAKKPKKKTAID
jgi:hypothetical protein